MNKKLEYIAQCHHKQAYYSRQKAENSLRPVFAYYGGALRLKVARCEVCNLWIHVKLKAANEA